MKNVWPNYDIAPFRKGEKTYLRQCDQPLARLNTEEYYKAIFQGLRFSPKSLYSIALCNLAYDNNIGNCIRSADAFGAKSVYLLGSKQFNKKSAVGSYYDQSILHVPTLEGWRKVKEDFDQVIAVDNNNCFPAERTISLEQLELKGKTLLLFGNEGFGIPETLLKDCDLQVNIPMAGTTRSINVASACSIVLYQAMTYKPNE